MGAFVETLRWSVYRSADPAIVTRAWEPGQLGLAEPSQLVCGSGGCELRNEGVYHTNTIIDLVRVQIF